ncbi:MAG: transglycosylase SLT domain-containing protein [Acidobacteriota bacterium]|nr:transglycosylase SLT domain-containing protein [Acidobacteriota bacterium]
MILREWFRANWRVPVLATLAFTGITVSVAAQGDAVSELRSAIAALQSNREAAAAAALKSLDRKLPKIADYIAWFRATAEFSAGNYAAVATALDPVWSQTPTSPLIGRAALLAAQAYQQTANTSAAVSLLRKHYSSLPQPQGDLAVAKAMAAAGDPVSAAVYAQRVYYGYPVTTEASEADALAANLESQLGDKYPPVLGSALLGRALKLLDAGQGDKARKELITLLPRLTGPDRDTAQVKIGVAQYNAKDTKAAQKYLAELVVESPAADAERMYYLLLCARRANDRDSMNGVLTQLASLHANSIWRLEALLAVANSYLIENQVDAYAPLYRACFEFFPKETRAAGCHWKVTWAHYLRRKDDARDLLREHLRLFPNSDESSAALYFLARLAEGSDDPAAARAYYTEIVREYPNYFYTGLARERLAAMPPTSATPSAPVADFLRTVDFNTRARVRNFEPNVTAKLRLERARLLVSAGLDDWAEIELRFAAQIEDQPHVMGLELATMADRRAQPDKAMRYLKRYAPDYLYLRIDSAPDEFWKLAFPLPYRADFERFARQNSLDPFLFAALARQESEFNPKAVSESSARGLTQIMPPTGRELSRQLRLKPYSTASLFQPQVNLKLGSFYLKSLTDSVEGRLEAALAAYNAGLSRAKAWSTWGEFREAAEFVETVPFTQTREYIQIVLRNADIYRQLYANEKPPAPTNRLSYSNGIDQRRKSSRATGAP